MFTVSATSIGVPDRSASHSISSSPCFFPNHLDKLSPAVRVSATVAPAHGFC
jgi:hypothetical protein